MKHLAAAAAVLSQRENLAVLAVAAPGPAMAERLLSLHQFTVGMVILAVREDIFKPAAAVAVQEVLEEILPQIMQVVLVVKARLQLLPGQKFIMQPVVEAEHTRIFLRRVNALLVEVALEAMELTEHQQRRCPQHQVNKIRVPAAAADVMAKLEVLAVAV